jgi:transposase
MKGFSLTPEQIQELRSAHKSALKSNEKLAYKINAVILLGSGWTLEEVAEALLLDDETLRTYVKNYLADGISALMKNNYKGSEPKLSEEQTEKLCIELDAQIYPTTQSIAEYIHFTFGIQYSLSGLTDLLRRLDYVYKKPKLVPGNPDIAAQDIFLAQYNEFMQNKKEDEAVFFVDGVHPTHNTLASFGWIKKGREAELQSNSGRSRLNIHGAMNAETFETTIISSENNINTDSTISLFEYLLVLYPLASMIYIILDNAKYHFSKEVQEWVKNNPRIKLIPLPSYSPELNLIERLWRVFKKNILYNKYYKTFDEFKKVCDGFFKNQHKYSDQIASIMGDGLAALA